MTNPWFRLYSEFAHDPKVQMMPEAMQRRYIMLMCMRCSNVTVTLRDDEIAFQLRISDAELAETKRLFISKGFIDDAWNLVNWDKRQFASDHDPSGAERQKRYREKQREIKAVTLRNGQVTPPDTDTDTDKKNTPLPPAGGLADKKSETEAKNLKPATGSCRRFEEFWSAWPKSERKQDKVKCAEKWRRQNLDEVASDLISDIAVKCQTKKWQTGFVEAPLSYLGGKRWLDGVEAEGQSAMQWAGAI